MIYFAQEAVTGLIKIGTTRRLSRRLIDLKAEYAEQLELLGVAEGSHREESGFHDRFSHLRVGGEWFRPGEDLLACISQESAKWDGTDEAEPIEIVTLSFRLEPPMAKIIDDLAAEHRHTRSVTILILVEKALKSEGLWPKKPK